MAGVFLHSRHGSGGEQGRNRLAGWWGHTAHDRFAMRTSFSPSPGAQGFQLSNPCVLAMAALKASCDEFEDAGGMGVLRERSLVLTGYLELALEASGLLGNVLGTGGGWKILTPRDPSQRGAQLSLSYDHDSSLGPGRLSLRDIYKKLSREGVIVDIREVSDGAFFTERFFLYTRNNTSPPASPIFASHLKFTPFLPLIFFFY